MASSSSSSSSTSTPGIKTFKKPFHDKAIANAKANVKKDKDDDEDKDKQDFERRLGKIKESLEELQRAVVVLKSAKADEWQEFDDHARNLQSWIQTHEEMSKAAGFNFKKGYEAIDAHKEGAYKTVKRALAVARPTAGLYHAQTLMNQLQSDLAAKHIPQKVFDDLNQKFSAASAPTIKRPEDAQDLYVIFAAAAATALKEYEEARAEWNSLAPQKARDEAERLEKLARVLKLDPIAKHAKSTAEHCTQAIVKHIPAGNFVSACKLVRTDIQALPGLKQNYEAQTQKHQKGSDLFQGLRQPTEAILQFGKDHKIDWLITAAEKVIKGMDAAVADENFGTKEHAKSRQMALKVLPEIAELNDLWDALKEWDELNLVLTQYLGLAKTFVASAQQHQTNKSGNVSEWQQIEKQAQDFPASIKPAQDLAQQGKPRDAIKAAKTPRDAFVNLKENKYNKAIKDKVNNDFQTLSSTNPNGPEAQLQTVLNKQEVQEMLVPAHNLLELAKQEGLPANTLSHGDAVAIYAYTNEQTCNAIQAHLRNPNQTDPNEKQRLDMIAKLAEDAMRKLPTYTGAPTQRGERDWSGADARYQVNSKPFTINFFWSTSVGAAFEGLYQITVKPNPAKANAKMITAFSQYVKEGEVVFPKGTTFKVISRNDVSKDRIEVYVEEV